MRGENSNSRSFSKKYIPWTIELGWSCVCVYSCRWIVIIIQGRRRCQKRVALKGELDVRYVDEYKLWYYYNVFFFLKKDIIIMFMIYIWVKCCFHFSPWTWAGPTPLYFGFKNFKLYTILIIIFPNNYKIIKYILFTYHLNQGTKWFFLIRDPINGYFKILCAKIKLKVCKLKQEQIYIYILKV